MMPTERCDKVKQELLLEGERFVIITADFALVVSFAFLQVVYFTATFPYLVITILLIRGLTLDGAVDGLLFYLRPDFTRLNDINVRLYIV